VARSQSRMATPKARR